MPWLASKWLHWFGLVLVLFVSVDFPYLTLAFVLGCCVWTRVQQRHPPTTRDVGIQAEVIEVIEVRPDWPDQWDIQQGYLIGSPESYEAVQDEFNHT
jgi:hypothetical protein